MVPSQKQSSSDPKSRPSGRPAQQGQDDAMSLKTDLPRPANRTREDRPSTDGSVAFCGTPSTTVGSAANFPKLPSLPQPLPGTAPGTAPSGLIQKPHLPNIQKTSTTDQGWPKGGSPRLSPVGPPTGGPLEVTSPSAIPVSPGADPGASFDKPKQSFTSEPRVHSEGSSTIVVSKTADSRRRIHPRVAGLPRSNLTAEHQSLQDYNVPSVSWRGLRVRIGAAPLANARLHLFGLQSFSEYLASCGASQRGSALAFDYVGPDVNRAARVAGSARGGEVVMPQPMMNILPPDLIGRLSTVAMGGVFLKGIGNSGDLVSVLPRGLHRVFTSASNASHCERCYGLLSCAACEADDDRLGDWVAPVE